MVRDDIGPEPERYYDWMLWKLRQSEKWKEAIKYSKQKMLWSGAPSGSAQQRLTEGLNETNAMRRTSGGPHER